MAKRKRNRGQFGPGESGNPGGRPRALVEFRLAAREHSTQALEVLVRIMNSRKASSAARVAAVRELLDRAFGRAQQELLVEGSMVKVTVDAKDLTDTKEGRRDLAKRLVLLLRLGEGREEEH